MWTSLKNNLNFFLQATCRPNKICHRLKQCPDGSVNPQLCTPQPGSVSSPEGSFCPRHLPGLQCVTRAAPRASSFSICRLVSLMLEQTVFMACRALWTAGWSGCLPGVLLASS